MRLITISLLILVVSLTTVYPGCLAQTAPAVLKTIHLDKTTSIIRPIYGYKDSTRSERIQILLIRDSCPVTGEDTTYIPFTITQLTLPFKPSIVTINPIAIPKKDWKSNAKITGDMTKDNVMRFDSVNIEISNQYIDTLKSVAIGYLTVPGGDASFHAVQMTNKGVFPRSPNFFVGSFIKSIAGTTIPTNELLDIFLKINLTSSDQNNKRIWFSMIGADAGLSDTTILSLNEAVANVNHAFNKIDRDTKRIGFYGAGLKVFENQAYFGGHLGLMEIDGIFQGSYFTAGYYYSPWIGSVQKAVSLDSANRYRNNIYFEAAFNAFGDNAPKALQYLRIKFGLMLPMAVGRTESNGHVTGDTIIPHNGDFLYRLAIEVPIGGPIKF